MAKRYSVVVTILLILAAVFYVSLRFFASGNVIQRTSSGGLVVSSEALQVKIIALVGFMAVSIIGLYVCMSLLTNPDFEKEERRDRERTSLWNVYLHELRFPAFETEEEEED